MSIEPTPTAILSPSIVPLEIASIKLTPIFSLLTFKWVLILSGSISGMRIFEKIIAAGAFIIEAVNKCVANSC